MQSISDIAADQNAQSDVLGQVSFLHQALWKQLGENSSRETFANAWLTLQCRLIDNVSCGVVVLRDEAGKGYLPVASWPEGETSNPELISAVEMAISKCQGVLQGQKTSPLQSKDVGESAHSAAYPIVVSGEVCGVVAVQVPSSDDAHLRQVMRQLQWGAAWVELRLHREASVLLENSLDQTTLAIDLVATVLEEADFPSAVTALVTDLAMKFDCQRVTAGMFKSGRAKVVALSNTAFFSKRMDLIRNLAAAMEESIDQKSVILYPVPDDAKPLVTNAHAAMARHHGEGWVLTVPLMKDEACLGALTFERASKRPFSQNEIDLIDGTAAIVGPILEERRKNDRMVVFKVAESAHRQGSMLIGPRHFGRKVVVAAVALLAVFFSFAMADYRITSPATLEGAIQRVVAAPWDGFISTEHVRAGDRVVQGQILATLDTKDLDLERIRWIASRQQTLREYDRAMANTDRSQTNIIKSQIDQATAQIALNDSKISRAEMRAPFDGIIVWGDLRQKLGSSVKQGDDLFKIAPLDAYRVILEVNESSIGDINIGQRGSLVLSSMPEAEMLFTVSQVTPVSEAKEGRNYFRVEASLDKVDERLRPGMLGVGKVQVDRRKLIWVWTHEMVDWVRLSIWRWWP